MLRYIGVHRSEMEEFTPLSLETNGLDVRKYRASQHVSHRSVCNDAKGSLLRESFLTLCCALAPKIPVRAVLTVKSHVLSYHSPDVHVCPGRPEPIQARGFPCSVVSLCPATIFHPGDHTSTWRGRSTTVQDQAPYPARGSPACGFVTEDNRWSSTCVQCAVCRRLPGACTVGLLSIDELCYGPEQQGSPSRLLYI